VPVIKEARGAFKPGLPCYLVPALPGGYLQAVVDFQAGLRFGTFPKTRLTLEKALALSA
jgi:hypothetical protein